MDPIAPRRLFRLMREKVSRFVPDEDLIQTHVSNHSGYQPYVMINECTLFIKESIKLLLGSIMVILIILGPRITYQSILTPPAVSRKSNEGGYRAGETVLSTTYNWQYLVFFYCNATAAFVAALLLLMTQVTISTPAPTDCFILELLEMPHFGYGWIRYTYTVGRVLLCTLQFVFKAIGNLQKVQLGVTRDSESTRMGNHRQNEQENTSGSQSRVDNHDVINAVAKTAATWLVASAATHHATGNRSILSGFKTVDGIHIQAGDGVPMAVRGRGSVVTDTVVLPDVMFVPGLTQNIVSASQLIELDYSVGFTRGVCYIRGATDGTIIGKAPAQENGMFQLEFLKVPLLN